MTISILVLAHWTFCLDSPVEFHPDSPADKLSGWKMAGIPDRKMTGKNPLFSLEKMEFWEHRCPDPVRLDSGRKRWGSVKTS